MPDPPKQTRVNNHTGFVRPWQQRTIPHRTALGTAIFGHPLVTAPRIFAPAQKRVSENFIKRSSCIATRVTQYGTAPTLTHVHSPEWWNRAFVEPPWLTMPQPCLLCLWSQVTIGSTDRSQINEQKPFINPRNPHNPRKFATSTVQQPYHSNYSQQLAVTTSAVICSCW